MRRLIALGASIFLLAIGASAAPAFAQDSSADQSAGIAGGSQASISGTTEANASNENATEQAVEQENEGSTGGSFLTGGTGAQANVAVLDRKSVG